MPSVPTGWQAFYDTRTSRCYRCTPGNQPRAITRSGTIVLQNTGCLTRCPVADYTVVLAKSGRRSDLAVGTAFMT
jgi:hypothetical protein